MSWIKKQNNNKLIFIIIFTIWINSSICYGNNNDCGPKFHGKCICGINTYDHRQYFIVNCTNTNFDNTDVLEHMPINVEVLIFQGNQIPELQWNIFGSIDKYKNLTIVDMSNNQINEIRGKTYHHVPNVRKLILNHNNLSISKFDDEFNHYHPRVFSSFINLAELHLTNTFMDNSPESLSENLHDIFINSNLTKVIKLHLEQNELSKFIDHNIFCALPSLQDLHLGDNYLKEINFNISCIKNLRYLDLERNKFEYVKQKDINLLNKLKILHHNHNLTIDFSQNPFQCNCNLSTFINWIVSLTGGGGSGGLSTKLSSKSMSNTINDTTTSASTITIRRKENLFCYNKIQNEWQSLLPQTLTSISYKTDKCNILSNSNMESSASVGHNIILAVLLILLCGVLIALLGAIVYLSSKRIKYMISPIVNSVSRRVHYATIRDEECQEVHV